MQRLTGGSRIFFVYFCFGFFLFYFASSLFCYCTAASVLISNKETGAALTFYKREQTRKKISPFSLLVVSKASRNGVKKKKKTYLQCSD